MSNLATAGHLRRATSQLPVSWYCDPSIYDAEQKRLFARAPGYVGHELMVPNVGDYYALDWRDNAQVLVRSEEHTSELQSQSNIVCRLLLEKKKQHRHAKPNDKALSCAPPDSLQ